MSHPNFRSPVVLVLLATAAAGCEPPADLGSAVEATSPGASGGSGGANLVPTTAQATGTLPLARPGADWSTEFDRPEPDRFTVRTREPGAMVYFGAEDLEANDHAAAMLRFPGRADVPPMTATGPAHATAVSSRAALHFGTYTARLRPATCRPDEEMVTGYFTYFNDGRDHDGDGLVDNQEIDIEILCSTPSVVWLTAWTQYDERRHSFRKWTRSIDLRTGRISESTASDRYGVTPIGVDPTLAVGAPAPGGYWELGFEWHADSLRWFMMRSGREVTLWELRDQARVPQHAGGWLFNLWHPATHWRPGGGPAAFPTQDAYVTLDWARHYPE